jgi:hypothetical protein
MCGSAPGAERCSMRRCLAAPLLAAGILVASSAIAGTSPVQQRAGEVRWAIPAAMAYQADHGTWRGMTVAKLRRYYSITNVVVARATRTAFCIQSTRPPFVHFDGPVGKVRQGRCGVRGAVVPFVPKPGTRPKSPPTAEQQVRAAIPAVEAYAADHNGYAGMTLAALRRYDPAVDVTIVRAARNTYCIERGTGAEQYHKDGPGAEIAPGPCPAG